MRLLQGIKSRSLLVVKGALMLASGMLVAALLITLHPDWMTVALLAATIFGFCRFYYFAFCVIELFDSTYKFASLTSALLFLLSKKERSENESGEDN